MILANLLWILVGFFLAIIWDIYKDWKKFRANLQWVYDELNDIKKYLESSFAELPDDEIKQKLRDFHQRDEQFSVDTSDLLKRPFIIPKPHHTSAWLNFISNGYSERINEKDYEVISNTYNSLEDSNFFRGSIPTFVAITASHAFSNEIKNLAIQSMSVAPIYPLIHVTPKIDIALNSLNKILDVNSLCSFMNFIWTSLRKLFRTTF